MLEYLRVRDRSSRGIRIAARSEAATKPLGTLGEKEMERFTSRYIERQRNGSCDFGKNKWKKNQRSHRDESDGWERKKIDSKRE
jgi:hypothetical protein